MKEIISPCFNCKLPDCDDKNPECAFKRPYRKTRKKYLVRYYSHIKNDPKLSEEYSKKNRERTKKWNSNNGTLKKEIQKRWLLKNPDYYALRYLKKKLRKMSEAY